MSLKQLMSQFARPVTADQGEHLFTQGEASRDLFIIEQGLLKAYYISHEGQERIKSFLLPGDVIGSLSALKGDEGCSFNLVCLQPSKLQAVSFDAVYEAAQNDARLSGAIVEFLVAYGMKKEQREFELLCLSAEDRYRRLLSNRPELLDMVYQSDIALYLGVTPVGLSRIRKRVEAA